MEMKGYAEAAICALIITNVAAIALVSDTDISNQTITNGLEDCNAFGNFEWTAMIRSDNALCSGVLIHPKYVLTAGKQKLFLYVISIFLSNCLNVVILAHCFSESNLTHLGNIKVEFGNAAKPQTLQLKSPEFYVPLHQGEDWFINKMFDIQIIELERTLDDIDPVLLPLNAKDFYFIENEELVTVTLRNEHKQRLTSGNRHEKCTKIHTRSAKWCAGEFSFFLKGLPDFSSIEEPSQFPMLCTTEYEPIPGESGGPLVQKLPSGKWVVVGIVSGGLRVEDDLLHSDFVSTAGHLKWINSIILQ